MTSVDNNLNGLELLSGKLVTLFLTLAEAKEAVKTMPAGTKVKVTNDPNPDLNGEYEWDGVKLVKTTNNTLEKAKEQAEDVAKGQIKDQLTTENILEMLSGSIDGSHLDRRLEQRIERIPSITTNVEELKNDVKIIQNDVDIKVRDLNIDINNIRTEVDDKFVEVDDIRKDLEKEVADRIADVTAEREARIEVVSKLQDGLTQEVLDREEGDKEVLAYVDTYKKSNDDAMAVIRDEVQVAVDTANASAIKVDSMDVRVTSAENNAQKALENSASAVTKVEALATDVGAISSRVDSLSADVVKAVDDSGKALVNSANAIESAKTAVDVANATAETVTIVQAKLNDKSTTYRETTAPTKATHPDLTKGDVWINPDMNNQQMRWDGSQWVDISDVRVGDNATAISKLTATVTEHDGKITAQAERVDNLETSIGNKVDSSAFEQLKSTVTEQDGKIQSNTESITALQGSIAGKADAKALDDLKVTVTQQGEDIVAQGQAITSVQTKLDGKADSSTVSALESKVETMGDTVTAQGQAIIAVQNSLNDKADASAVTQLKSTVEQQGEQITSQGQAITKVEAKVENIAVGSENLITDAGVWSSGIAHDPNLVVTLSEENTILSVESNGIGNPVAGMLEPFNKVLKVDLNCNEGDDVIFSVEVMISNGSTTAAPDMYWKSGMDYLKLDLVKGQQQMYGVWQRYYQTRKYVKGVNEFHFGFAGRTGSYKLRRPIVERGNIPTAWNSSMDDYATASAVQILDAKVTTIGNKTDANAQAITDLRTSVGGKADSSALESLKSTVTEQGNTITSQGEAITSVTATAGKTANQVGTTKNYTLFTIRNGFNPEYFGLFGANGVKLATLGRGLNVYTFNKDNGDLADYRSFDTYLEETQVYLDMQNHLSSIPFGTFALISGADHVGWVGGSTNPEAIALRNMLYSEWGLSTETLRQIVGNSIPVIMTKKGASPFSADVSIFQSDVNNDRYEKMYTFVNGIPSVYGGDHNARVIDANSTAISKMNATVEQHGQDITAQAQAITGLQSSIAGKADANALSQLETKVAQQGDVITSQGTALTQVEANLFDNSNHFLNSAFSDPSDLLRFWARNDSARLTVQSWFEHTNAVRIQAVADNLPFSGINQVLGLDDTLYSGKKIQLRFLTSSPINRALRVGIHYLDWNDNLITQSWQTFSHSVGYTNTHNLNFPAVDGVTKLRVMFVEEVSRSDVEWYLIQPQVTTGNVPIKAYSPSALDGIKIGSTNATATQNLEATVNNINGKVEANAEALTKVQTTAGNAVNNLLENSNRVHEKPVGSNPYPFWTAGGSKPLVLGKWYTLVYEAEFQSGGGNSHFAPYIHGNVQFEAHTQSFGRQVIVSRVRNDYFGTGTGTAISFYVIGGQPDQNNAYAKVYWACLYEDDVSKPVLQWQPNSFETTALVQQSLQSINGIRAEYTVKTDVNGYVAGIGLINEGAGKSQFIIRADMFAVASPAVNGNETKYAFVYRSSPVTLPNGTVIPAGLYVDNLMMPEVRAERIYADSIRAISANLGTFESSNASGTTIISGSLIEVRDSTGRTRVKIGVW